MTDRRNNVWIPRIIGGLVAVVLSLIALAWDGHEGRIAAIETRGSPAIRERLAAIEQKLDYLQIQLDRVERRLIVEDPR